MLRTRRRGPTPEAHLRELGLPEPTRSGEVSWIEPYPDALLEGLADSAPGPEVRYETREAISLAFVTVLRLLPPRQRAVQILRDVLGYQAKEVAQILDSSEASVTSALKRARATLQVRLPPPNQRDTPPATSAAERELVERFTRALEWSDMDGVVVLLTDDVLFNMPPLPFEWQGRDRAVEFLAIMWQGSARRLVPTRANRQPAFGLYISEPNARVLQPMGLLVLTLAGTSISMITRFQVSVLSRFGLPQSLPM